MDAVQQWWGGLSQRSAALIGSRVRVGYLWHLGRIGARVGDTMRAGPIVGAMIAVLALGGCRAPSAGAPETSQDEPPTTSSIVSATETTLATPGGPAALGGEFFEGRYFEAWNAGDAATWLSFFDDAGSWYGVPVRRESSMSAVEGRWAFGDRVLSARCYKEGNDFRCDVVSEDNLHRLAGLTCSRTEVFSLNEENLIVSVVGDGCPGYLTFDMHFRSWLVETHSDEMHTLYVNRASSEETADFVIAMGEEFLAYSTEYPVVGGLLFPAPVLSATIEVGPGEGVDVYNASHDQIRLVEWAVDCFEDGALEFPHVSVVTFPPAAACERGLTGYALHREEGSSIELCVTSGSVCAEEAGACAAFARPARTTVLHELAHIWNTTNASESDKERFVAQRGLDAWFDEDEPWNRRGSEHAADILMWGLMDEPVPMMRIGRDTCDQLAAGYVLLTGTAPDDRLSDCIDDPR